MFGFKTLTTLVYNAKANGKVERKFRDVKQDMAIKFQENEMSWWLDQRVWTIYWF